MNIIFVNLNINAKIVEICVYLNIIFNNIFNNNKNKYELLNIFKKSVKIWSRTLSCIFFKSITKERAIYIRAH